MPSLYALLVDSQARKSQSPGIRPRAAATLAVPPAGRSPADAVASPRSPAGRRASGQAPPVGRSAGRQPPPGAARMPCAVPARPEPRPNALRRLWGNVARFRRGPAGRSRAVVPCGRARSAQLWANQIQWSLFGANVVHHDAARIRSASARSSAARSGSTQIPARRASSSAQAVGVQPSGVPATIAG